MLLPGLRVRQHYRAVGGMALRACYAMSGTDIAYQPTRFLRDVRVSAYALTTRCPVLAKRMVVSAYAPSMPGSVLIVPVLLPVWSVAGLYGRMSRGRVSTGSVCSYALPTPCPVLTWRMLLMVLCNVSY
eukprot:3941737-Rhodomonas_salina.5